MVLIFMENQVTTITLINHSTDLKPLIFQGFISLFLLFKDWKRFHLLQRLNL